MNIWPWVGFTTCILILLIVDLGLLQRRPHAIGTKEAMTWFAVWTGLAMLFNLGIVVWHQRGWEAGMEFFTGYLVEKSLSIDNIFVFILIFQYFNVAPAYQHKVLFWGILGAILMRIIFIVGGLALMKQFHWMNYVFGALLLATGIGMMRKQEKDYSPEKNWVLRLCRNFLPVMERYQGDRFVVWDKNRLWATPLFIVLLAIESSDILFAADSIPAVFAVTSDPFIVYTSNIFAILGLRALYFAVAGFMRTFHYLHVGFAAIILMLGMKLLLSEHFMIPTGVSLVLIVNILSLCVIVSLLRPRQADLKSVFGRMERIGLIPLQRLLLIENILDFGTAQVDQVMVGTRDVKAIQLDRPWHENLEMIRSSRFSRYPVVTHQKGTPDSVVHLKNLLVTNGIESMTPHRVLELARPCPVIGEAWPLETAWTTFRERQEHMAVVVDTRGEWTGILTVEDILERIVGRVRDEFDGHRGRTAIDLVDTINPKGVFLNLQAKSLDEAVGQILARSPANRWVFDPSSLARSTSQLNAATSTLLQQGVAITHAVCEEVGKPMMLFARSDDGIPVERENDRVEFIIVLLAPPNESCCLADCIAEIVGMLASDYIIDRLRTADTPKAVIETIRLGQYLRAR